MSLSPLPSLQGGPVPAVPGRAVELRAMLAIAGPLVAAYLAEFAMVLVSKAVVGRLGYRELAGIGLAMDISAEVVVILAGLLSVVGVLVAQAHGAGRNMEAGLAARQGLIVAGVLGVPASVAVWHLDKLLALTGQDPDIIALMAPFLHPLSASVLPVLWFLVLRTFVAALARTGAVMVITVAAVGLNWVLCLGLVEGRFGLTELGVAGAGWAKTIVSFAMLVVLTLYIYVTPSLRNFGLFRSRLRIDPAMLAEIFRLGVPVAGLVVLEAGLFMAVSILSGVLGAVALATYQVIIAWVGIAFMVSHGLAEAGMVRVAFGIGRGSLGSARQAGLLTFVAGIACLVVLTAVPLNFPEPLVRLFLDAGDPGFDDVLDLTRRLLILVAFFQVFDGLQVMASLALRGLKDTVVPLWLAAFGYWAMGIAGGWTLAFPLGMGADGLWWGMAAGLTVTGSLLAFRFIMLTSLRGHR